MRGNVGGQHSAYPTKVNWREFPRGATPWLFARACLTAADSALIGHPVGARLVAVVGEPETELISLRKESIQMPSQLGEA